MNDLRILILVIAINGLGIIMVLDRIADILLGQPGT